MWSVGFSIATARNRKLLKRFVATPMVRAYYLASFIVSRLLFLAIETAVLMVFAWLVFGVTDPGIAVRVRVACCRRRAGVWWHGAARRQPARTIEAISGLLNFVMLPMWICSGVFFASTNFPDAAQPVIQVLPLTALIDALRDIANDGESLAAVAPDLGILALWGGVVVRRRLAGSSDGSSAAEAQHT